MNKYTNGYPECTNKKGRGQPIHLFHKNTLDLLAQ